MPVNDCRAAKETVGPASRRSGPVFRRLWLIALALGLLLLAPQRALAYIGPGPGMELIPYFLSLLAWVGVAFGSILLWPIYSLIRRLRGTKDIPKEDPNTEATPVNTPEVPDAPRSESHQTARET